MKENKGLVGIVCNEEKTEAYCIKGNSNYEHLRNTTIVYIPLITFGKILFESSKEDRIKFNINEVLKYEVKEK